MADDTVNVKIELPEDAKHSVSIRARSDMTGRDSEATSLEPGASTTLRVTAHDHIAISLGAYKGGEDRASGALDPAPPQEEGTTGKTNPADTGE